MVCSCCCDGGWWYWVAVVAVSDTGLLWWPASWHWRVGERESNKARERREKKYKIIDRRSTGIVHICTVTVAIVNKCIILHSLMWIFFAQNVKIEQLFLFYKILHILMLILLYSNGRQWWKTHFRFIWIYLLGLLHFTVCVLDFDIESFFFW